MWADYCNFINNPPDRCCAPSVCYAIMIEKRNQRTFYCVLRTEIGVGSIRRSFDEKDSFSCYLPWRRELIDESVVDQIAEKVRRLPVRRGVSVRTALVYEGRLAPGIAEDGGIDMLIPVSRFFESSNSL